MEIQKEKEYWLVGIRQMNRHANRRPVMLDAEECKRLEACGRKARPTDQRGGRWSDSSMHIGYHREWRMHSVLE